VAVAFGDTPHASRRAKLLGYDSHRDACPAMLTSRPVGDRLAAAKATVGEQVVELARALADQVREHLALLLARQIGARRRSGQVELRSIARMLGHGCETMVRPARIARRRPPVKRLDTSVAPHLLVQA